MTELTIPYKAVDVVFIRNLWDGLPLAGDAWYNGDYCYFDGGWSDTIKDEANKRERYTNAWKLYKLTGDDLVNSLISRKLFEDLIGYYCTQLPNNQKLVAHKAMPLSEHSKYFDDPRWQPYRGIPDVTKLEYVGTFGYMEDWVKLDDDEEEWDNE
jgi:hypothetical protein